MQLTVSEARAKLGLLCARAQDPRQVIVLTRHGRPLAAIVSIAEVKRIWDLGDAERQGWRHALSGVRGWWSSGRGIVGLEPGPDGRYVTKREAAQQVRDIQMTRADERRILKAGGLEPVPGGEIAERLSWWQRWRLRRAAARARG